MPQLYDGHDVQHPVDLPVPLRESRWWVWSPEEASTGAVPVQDAKWLRSGKRVMSTTSTSSRAAPEGPMPCRSIRPVPVALTRDFSSLSAALVRA
ncbi:hypothetical protein BJF82_14350 [Kytococcus sp. CUA-901]|nr:hypothetical protein BJF82_14350 [Kytococcus sp. CUA-901]